jgi:hypothetical protein
MNVKTNLILDTKDSDLFYSLLSEEDFDFKTKDILISISREKDLILANIECSSILDLKIATNALVKSLEVINKSLEV